MTAKYRTYVYRTDLSNQPLTYVRIARVVTPDGFQRFKRRRSSQLAVIHDAITGGKCGAQLDDELDKEGWDKLLKDEAFST